jgi:hypothetical protein
MKSILEIIGPDAVSALEAEGYAVGLNSVGAAWTLGPIALPPIAACVPADLEHWVVVPALYVSEGQ